nr:hypothetical protein [Acidobacteriota bacterium]
MRRIVLLVIVLCAMAVAAKSQNVMRAGVARADITPPPGVEMWGYFDRAGPATGTLDPLFARVLVLDDGRQAVALITLDLGRSFGPPQIAWLRDKARRQHQVKEVMLIASHTHSGPVIDDSYDDGLPEWERLALEKIADAIGEACAKLKPARIGVGLGQAVIGHN